MSRQARIREELKVAEEAAMEYDRRYRRMASLGEGYEGWSYSHYEGYLHFMGRRRFWIKTLLKVQLKEFDHG